MELRNCAKKKRKNGQKSDARSKKIPLSYLLPRINALSTPKRSIEVQKTIMDCSTIIKPEKRYISPISFVLLSKPKSVVPKWTPPKPVEYISIPDHILSYRPTEKIIALAKPKSITPKFAIGNEKPNSGVSSYVLNYTPSERIENLAQPRRRLIKLIT